VERLYEEEMELGNEGESRKLLDQKEQLRRLLLLRKI
jgi:hypothetical protein